MDDDVASIIRQALNRGHDSVAVYGIDQDGSGRGLIGLVDITPSGVGRCRLAASKPVWKRLRLQRLKVEHV
jgi:hypothetical protein